MWRLKENTPDQPTIVQLSSVSYQYNTTSRGRDDWPRVVVTHSCIVIYLFLLQINVQPPPGFWEWYVHMNVMYGYYYDGVVGYVICKYKSGFGGKKVRSAWVSTCSKHPSLEPTTDNERLCWKIRSADRKDDGTSESEFNVLHWMEMEKAIQVSASGAYFVRFEAENVVK
jgi:hypothetical protein